MFSLLAILAIVLTISALPIVAAALFARSNRDDGDSEKELQAIAVRVEKYQNSWRARHQTSNWEI